eukprot:gene17682-20000_t
MSLLLVGICFGASSSSSSSDTADILSPLPAGWSSRSEGLCNGHPHVPFPSSCTILPTYTGQCAWNYTTSAYVPGGFAAAKCAEWDACKAVTCGPSSSGGAVNWCWARSEFTSTCSVPGYVSIAPFPPPPPPPPPFRLPASLADSMVLQQAPKRAVLWGWSSPMATVTATVTATVRASARTATVAAVTAATASTPLAAAAAPIACSAVANASGVWRLLLPPVSAPS